MAYSQNQTRDPSAVPPSAASPPSPGLAAARAVHGLPRLRKQMLSSMAALSNHRAAKPVFDGGSEQYFSDVKVHDNETSRLLDNAKKSHQQLVDAKDPTVTHEWKPFTKLLGRTRTYTTRGKDGNPVKTVVKGGRRRRKTRGSRKRKRKTRGSRKRKRKTRGSRKRKRKTRGSRKTRRRRRRRRRRR